MSSDLDTALNAAKVVDRRLEDISERYEIGEMLGEGRFSQVFAATRGKNHYALKAVDMGTLEEDEEAVEALVQETTALRRAYAASSKHVPKLHECVQTPDTLYVVMDQVRGCELFEMLDQGALSESSARRIIAQLLSALHGLHRQGVVHRDVKPENLMVDDVDNPSKCRLVMVSGRAQGSCERCGERQGTRRWRWRSRPRCQLHPSHALARREHCAFYTALCMRCLCMRLRLPLLHAPSLHAFWRALSLTSGEPRARGGNAVFCVRELTECPPPIVCPAGRRLISATLPLRRRPISS